MKRSRWDTFDAADRQREEPYPQRQETNEDELPPLPPDDPPPLPPPDEPGLNPSSNTYHPADSSHVTHLWPSGHQYGHAGQGAWIHDPAGYRRLEETEPPAPPAPSEDWQPPPPPAPLSPAEGTPWEQGPEAQHAVPANAENAAPNSKTQPLSGPLPENDPNWADYAEANAQQPAENAQQWDGHWYQGYQQGYGQYEGYGLPQNDYGATQGSYQLDGSAAYAYQGPPGFADTLPWANPQARPLTGTQAASGPPLVPTRNEIDAPDIFDPPRRSQRPARIAIILRGLPGSGKSHIAKKLKELEVENGGEAPRIHALDDYFVTEVEKEVTDEQPGKKPKMRKITVMEYLYEQELEDSYRASILKAFTKTVEEGRFPFVILDAPNIQVEEFRPFYMAAQRMGYEVYVLKPLESDPEVCFKRNIHQRDRDTIADLAALYEPTPNLFTQLIVDSLFDLPKASKGPDKGIEEIDMEEDDREADDRSDEPKIKSRWAALEEDESPEEETPKPKKRKKKEVEEVQAESTPARVQSAASAGSKSASSILRKAGSAPPNKSLRWADEVPPSEGFSIGSTGVQLEEVYLVEGLGPEPEGNPATLSHKSFVELARKERTTEKHSFKDMMLGSSASVRNSFQGPSHCISRSRYLSASFRQRDAPQSLQLADRPKQGSLWTC